MEDKGMKSSDEGRARYLWDREKLSWVESSDKTGLADAATAVDAPLEATAEEVSAAAVSAEGEESQLRGAWIRLIGLSIDMVVLVLLQSIVQVIFGTESVLTDFLIPLIGFGYFVGLWTLRGQTPGKMAVGAKVVRLDGSPPGLTRSLLRYGVYLLYFFALGLSTRVSILLLLAIGVAVFSVVALSRSKRGLHDLAAGTMVINSRPRLMEDYDEEVWEAPDAEIDALELEEE